MLEYRLLPLVGIILFGVLITVTTAAWDNTTDSCRVIPNRRFMKAATSLTNSDNLYVPETFTRVDLGRQVVGFLTLYRPVVQTHEYSEELYVTKVLKRKLMWSTTRSTMENRQTYIQEYMEGLRQGKTMAQTTELTPNRTPRLVEEVSWVSIASTTRYNTVDLKSEHLFVIRDHEIVPGEYNTTAYTGIALMESSTPDRNYLYHLEYRITWKQHGILSFGLSESAESPSEADSSAISSICELMFYNLCRVTHLKLGDLASYASMYESTSTQ